MARNSYRHIRNYTPHSRETPIWFYRTVTAAGDVCLVSFDLLHAYNCLFQVGFGRGTPTNVLWIGNVAQNVTEGQLQRQFHPFGFVTRVIIDRQTWQALLSFDSVDAATAAFDSMRNRYVLGRKILVSMIQFNIYFWMLSSGII